MKKALVILLAVIMLVLSGCGIDIPGVETEGPTRPSNIDMVNFNAPVISVMVAFEAELELTLSYADKILEVKALDTDAGQLLEGMELVGTVYHHGMAAVLERAKDQGLLKNETTVSMTAQELKEDGWTISSPSVLLRPFQAFQEKYGITINCALTPAGEIPPEIAKMHTNHRDDHDEVICYNSTVTHFLTREIYKNGDYIERYHLSGDSIIWGNDGHYRRWRKVGEESVSYEWQSTDYISESFYVNGKVVRNVQTNADGTTYDYIYENGEVIRLIITDPDGTVHEMENWGSPNVTPDNNTPGTAPNESGDVGDEAIYEVTYYSNGNIETEITTWPNGNYRKDNYYENGNRASTIEQSEDCYSERYYDENGAQLSDYQLYADGSEYRETYENGVLTAKSSTEPDGDYFNETFYPNGNPATEIGHRDGDHWERRWDENGDQAFYYYLQADGYEHRETYENGVLIARSITEANGDYFNDTFYPNGNRASEIASQNGDYSERYWDENGDWASTYYLGADGYEHRETYENGVLIARSTTEANGDYSSETFHPNGIRASYIQSWSGNYMERHWDENEMPISERHEYSDGYKHACTYNANGELATSEEVFADGYSCFEFYENGVKILSKGYDTEGLYWEEQYDSDGKILKRIKEVSPGQFEEYTYENH